MPNTAFYPRNPRASDDQPTKVLAPGTPLRVISTEGTYVKVELEDGSIGFVPSIMVAEKSLMAPVPIVPDAPGGVYDLRIAAARSTGDRAYLDCRLVGP